MSENTDNEGLLKPGQQIRPIINENDVPDLVKKLYKLRVKRIKQLKSYDDKNFFIEVENEGNVHYFDDLCPHGYVLKILNSMDSKNKNLVDGQNQMMLFLKNRGFKVPFPVESVNGSLMEGISFKDNTASNTIGSEHIVRLLTFVPGRTLVEVPYTPQLLYECGSYLANVDNELKGFSHDTINNRKFLWMLQSIPEVQKFAFAVKDEKRNKLVNDIISLWINKIEPLVPVLEKGIIHGDFNEQNILVNEDENNADTHHIHGIIDFGDINRTCYIFEVAICIMYVMLDAKIIPPNDVGGYILAGYCSNRSISDLEWSILKDCVAARFAQSLILGAYSHEQDPDNEYLLTTGVKGWDILEKFWNTPSDTITSKWKSIISSFKI